MPAKYEKIGKHRNPQVQWTPSRKAQLWRLHQETNPKGAGCIGRAHAAWCLANPSHIVTIGALAVQLAKMRKTHGPPTCVTSATSATSLPSASTPPSTAPLPPYCPELGRRIDKHLSATSQVEGDFFPRQGGNCKGRIIPPPLLASLDAALQDRIGPTTGFWELNCLVYSASQVASEEIGVPSSRAALDAEKWLKERERAIRAKVRGYRATLTRVANCIASLRSRHKLTRRGKRNRTALERELGERFPDVQSLLSAKEGLRQKMVLEGRKLRDVLGRRAKQEQRTAFSLLGSASLEADNLASVPAGKAPSPKAVEDYWRGILTTLRRRRVPPTFNFGWRGWRARWRDTRARQEWRSPFPCGPGSFGTHLLGRLPVETRSTGFGGNTYPPLPPDLGSYFWG